MNKQALRFMGREVEQNEVRFLTCGIDITPQPRNEQKIDEIMVELGIENKKDILDKYDDMLMHVARIAWHDDVMTYMEYRLLSMDKPVFELNGRLKRTYGRFIRRYVDRSTFDVYKKIELAKIVYEYGTMYEIMDVVLHEICHAVVYFSKFDHSDYMPAFEYMLRLVGAGSTRTDSVDYPKHRYGCYGCGCEYSSVNKYKEGRYVCRDHKNKLVHVGRMTDREYAKLDTQSYLNQADK